MRIQETDRILKESRYARHGVARQDDEGVVAKAWRMVSSLPARFAGLFHKH
jgi:hypothetical protein